MNDRKSFYDIKSFYNKKAKLKASFKGMRYQVEQAESGDGGKKLRVSIWPEPFCYEKTPGNFIITNEFEYSEPGLDNAYEWVCGCYKKDTARWEHAMECPLDVAKEMGIL